MPPGRVYLTKARSVCALPGVVPWPNSRVNKPSPQPGPVAAQAIMLCRGRLSMLDTKGRPMCNPLQEGMRLAWSSILYLG